MLVAFVSLRVFTLQLWGNQRHLSEKYLRYITKASHQAPHLEFFTIRYYYYEDGHIFRCKRVDASWVVCDEVEYPAA
jgi:23S rRNA C2498 (ribose-2'-O)-methylase RlmM